MGLRINRQLAQERLAEAVAWALSDRQVPEEWLSRSAKIGQLRNKTFTVALGTGLLARATNDQVDTLTLKQSAGNRAYSARTLAHTVLVPGAITFGYDLRVTGPEPLNNQPFFRYERVDRMEQVMFPAECAYLVECLERVNDLRTDEALGALAAFLRVRIEAGGKIKRVDLRSTSLNLLRQVRAASGLTTERSEGGKRAQAMVAAALDLVFDDVRTARVNDPSRRFPGDVQAFFKKSPVVTVEVRSKPVSKSDAVQFWRAAATAGFNHAMLAALSRTQADTLGGMELLEEAWADQIMFFTMYESIGDLLLDAFAWSRRPLHILLRQFPQRVSDRLSELEVEPATLARWRDLVS